MISISNISFSYGKNETLRNISFDIAQGKIVGIIGPNGAGKSTLLSAIARLIQVQDGEIFVAGKDVRTFDRNDFAKTLAYLPQTSSVPFSISALEVVLMGRTPYVSPIGFESRDDVDIARKAMEVTDCSHFASRPVNELSGGERQRVMIARALAQQTKILLLDEPTTFLDIRHIQKIHSLLKQLRSEGKTIICALHDISLAASLCDKIALMRDGTVVQIGAPKEVLTMENIRRAFDADVKVKTDTDTSLPYFVY